MRRALFLFEIILILLFFNASCTTEKQKTELHFFYYPEKNVYYNPISKSFWYSLNGTKSWNTFTNGSLSEPTTLGRKIVINTISPEVFKDNENHRKLYAGKLLNINTIDSSQSKIKPVTEVVERTTIKKRKSVAAKQPTSNKQKKSNSIGKFINKIFGKHKQ
ncbi:MAG: hypothetical protein M3040_14260 [Bacteroidota bacterium]|nr:hypothetical protein [Bacteroidota bacterium]